MGEDKALIEYHGKPQYQHVFELLSACCHSVFISCRQEQQAQFKPLPTIADRLLDIGPMAALLAAFERKPKHAWLVLGCDYPRLSKAEVQRLIQHRDADALATVFRNLEHDWPEPLLGIWEPIALPLLQQAHAEGAYSLRRLLEVNRTKLLAPVDAASIQSIDTPDGRDSVNHTP